MKNIKKIFSDLNENILHFTFSRLGKMNSTNSDKPRPVKTHLTNQSNVFTILRIQKKFKSSTKWSNIRFHQTEQLNNEMKWKILGNHYNFEEKKANKT